VFYLPIWFQVVKDESPVGSGLRMLPFVLANVVMAMLSGGIVTKYGHLNPWLFLGSILVAISGGLVSTFTIRTSSPMINGVQVIGGFGAALMIQIPLIAVMVLLPANDIPIGTAICVFFQFFGGAIFLAIAENIFSSRLVSALHTHAPSLDAATVILAGAEGLRKVVNMEDPSALEGAIKAYNIAVTGTFYPVAAAGAIAFLFAFGVEWRRGKPTI